MLYVCRNKKQYMDIKELRVGNLVYGVSDRIETVSSIYRDNRIQTHIPSISESYYEESIVNFTPIPITEDLLYRLGFKLFIIQGQITAPNGWKYSEHFELQNVGAGYFRLYKPTAYAIGAENTHICFLHQLQNLIYILMGNELKVEL